jgi:hypothetical protein
LESDGLKLARGGDRCGPRAGLLGPRERPVSGRGGRWSGRSSLGLGCLSSSRASTLRLDQSRLWEGDKGDGRLADSGGLRFRRRNQCDGLWLCLGPRVGERLFFRGGHVRRWSFRQCGPGRPSDCGSSFFHLHGRWRCGRRWLDLLGRLFPGGRILSRSQQGRDAPKELVQGIFTGRGGFLHWRSASGGSINRRRFRHGRRGVLGPHHQGHDRCLWKRRKSIWYGTRLLFLRRRGSGGYRSVCRLGEMEDLCRLACGFARG